jgi:hypothetical protein
VTTFDISGGAENSSKINILAYLRHSVPRGEGYFNVVKLLERRALSAIYCPKRRIKVSTLIDSIVFTDE